VHDSVTLTIGRAEALVLFDLLADFRVQAHLPIRDAAQRATLRYLEYCLEKAIVEPFSPDYDQALEVARQAVVTKWGGQ
jgi:hypothetical protein